MSFPPSDSGSGSRATPAPRRVGRYELRGHLGSGAMGDVFLGWDPGAGREVALKTRRGGSAERFVREAQLMASLDHPGIVRVLDAGVDPSGLAYYACERVEGARDLRQAFSGLSLLERVELVRDAALAAGHAHQRGIVHRDLKPENVLVDSVGTVRVTDFGLATAEELERLTRTGALLGTPTHLAPEQWRALQGERVPVDPRSDVWALGVVLYEALTGQLPFEGASWMELSARILGGSFEAPSSVNAEVPRGLQRVCLSALALDPDRRPPDGNELASRIEGALVEQGGGSRGPLAVLAVVGGLLGAGLVAATWLFSSGAAPPSATPSTTPLATASLEVGESPGQDVTLGPAAALARAREQREGLDLRGALETLAALETLSPEALSLRSSVYVDLGEPQRALSDLDRGLELAPGDANLLGARARLQYAQGRGRLAEDDVGAALKEDPTHVSSLIVKSSLLTAKGEIEAGLLLLDGLISKHPERADVWSARAAALFRAGKAALALKDIERALAIDPKLGQPYSVRAAIYIARNDTPAAAKAVERGLAVDPGSAELWTNCGVIRMREGNMGKALEALSRALEIHPGRALALANRGFVNQALGRREEAARDFRAGLEKLGRSAPGRRSILEALAKLEQEARVEAAGLNPVQALAEATRLRDRRSPALALPIVERVLAEKPDLVEALYLRGNLLVLLGRHREAIEPLTRAIELDSTRREHFNDRGLAFQALGDQERAVKDFERVIEGWPEFARGWSNRAISRRMAGDHEGALADCNQALKLAPDYVNGFVNRANVFISLKRLEEAEADCDRALELEEHGFVFGLRGMVRQERGDLKGAEADYERFMEIAPRDDPRRPRIERLLRQLRAGQR
jgi:tetratricopeptide (TPR) repeat protein